MQTLRSTLQARKRGTARELFESVNDEGMRWLFLILPDDGWAITQNGERVAVGTADRPSLQAGVERFATLTHPVAAATECDPVVQKHLDRIEGKTQRGANGKGVTAAHASERPIPFSKVKPKPAATSRPNRSFQMEQRKKISVDEAREIGNQLGLDWTKVDLSQFRSGLEVELEHGARDPETNVTGDDMVLTGKIAWAHLKEFPDYYTRLEQLECDADAYWAARRATPVVVG